MFGRDEDDAPPTDGEQFDAVGRFEDDQGDESGDGRSFLAEPPDPTPDADDVHPRIKFHFWRVLLVFNVAILGLSLGPILVFLDGNRSLGVPLFVGGVVLFAYGVVRFRQAKAEIDELADESRSDSPDMEPDSGSDSDGAKPE